MRPTWRLNAQVIGGMQFEVCARNSYNPQPPPSCPSPILLSWKRSCVTYRLSGSFGYLRSTFLPSPLSPTSTRLLVADSCETTTLRQRSSGFPYMGLSLATTVSARRLSSRIFGECLFLAAQFSILPTTFRQHRRSLPRLFFPVVSVKLSWRSFCTNSWAPFRSLPHHLSWRLHSINTGTNMARQIANIGNAWLVQMEKQRTCGRVLR